MTPKFDMLFNSGNFKGAAELAADSPKGVLRTKETIARFQAVLTLNPKPQTLNLKP